MSREEGYNRYFSGRGPVGWAGHAALGGVLFLFDWAGLTYHRFGHQIFAWGPPRELHAIWWHLPGFVVISFLASARSRSRRQRFEAQRERDAKEAAPITLGLSPADDHAEPTNKSA